MKQHLIVFFQWIKKRRKIELFLGFLFGFFVIFTIVYSQLMARQIAKREEKQVSIWAKAILDKAKLLKTSNEIFKNLSEEERIKVTLYSKASKLILSENDNERLNLLLDIIKLNENIPTIVTNEIGVILEMRNTENMGLEIGEKLDKKSLKVFSVRKPIEVNRGKNKQFIYYTDSKIFKELQYYLTNSGIFFYNEIGSNAISLPVILVNHKDEIILSGNIDSTQLVDISAQKKLLAEFKRKSNSLEINIGGNEILKLHYLNSSLVAQLRWFPFVLYAIISVLIISIYITIKNIRTHEKNLIWVGMSKETAHQLGTPLSSLGGWIEHLKDSEISSPAMTIVNEMEKDLERLSLVADRFGKIGSKPKLELESIVPIIEDTISYFRLRSSQKIKLISYWNVNIYEKAYINKPLFDWVIENLIRNAIDAISDTGFIEIHCSKIDKNYIIDLKDSGKGISPENLEKIFEPGFTTKKRGWGLGLSLCKRIVEEYFEGKIDVKTSELGKGTWFRIQLNASEPNNTL